ncbi:MAG: hypothetical protein AAF438_06180 [Pseudomonadota bacterium]
MHNKEGKPSQGIFSDEEWLFFQNCLRPLRPIFLSLAKKHGLVPYAGTLWPFLGLRWGRLLWKRQLEILLQPQFVHNQQVVFDLRFVQVARLPHQINQEFCCGRFDVSDFAESAQMEHQLSHKLDLLGMRRRRLFETISSGTETRGGLDVPDRRAG